jgi:hypothetical protein
MARKFVKNALRVVPCDFVSPRAIYTTNSILLLLTFTLVNSLHCKYLFSQIVMRS